MASFHLGHVVGDFRSDQGNRAQGRESSFWLVLACNLIHLATINRPLRETYCRNGVLEFFPGEEFLHKDT